MTGKQIREHQDHLFSLKQTPSGAASAQFAKDDAVAWALFEIAAQLADIKQELENPEDLQW